jgi:hypothetical protein
MFGFIVAGTVRVVHSGLCSLILACLTLLKVLNIDYSIPSQSSESHSNLQPY